MKPGSKKSVVWDYYTKTKDKNGVVCILCKKEYKYHGNTTNMKKHLKRLHPIQLAEINNPPTLDKEDDDAMVLISDVDQNGNNIPNKENNPPTAAATLPSNQIINDQNQKRIPTKRTRQLKLFGARNNDELSDQCKNEIDGKLMKMITTDYQPLSIVENEGFREYSKKLNGAYNLPNRKLLTETMIPNLYEESVLKLKKMLDFVSDVAVTTDIWTSDSNRAYISVTIHFIYENKMCSYNVATREIFGSHTGENIGKVLSAILNEWNIFDKVVTIVSDNGANIKNAINEHLRKHHHPCVAHTLNLSVTDAIVSNQDLSAILKKCRSLVGHFKHSVLASEKLKNTQTQMNLPVLKVKQDVATRWNSCLIMIERLLQIKDSLAVVITSLPKAPENLDASEWFILKDCVAILKPAEVITTILSGEQYPTLSLVIPLIRGLQHSLQNLAIQTECGHMLKTSLADVVTRRLGCLERNKTVAKASFLDPRFKKVGFGLEENANNTQKWISDELSILINSNKNLIDATIVQPSSESPDTLDQSLLSDKPIDVWEFFDSKLAKVKTHTTPTTTAILSVKQYLELPYIERQNNPLDFWKKHKLMFPELYNMAMKYLCIPGTSVPSERVFSKAGQLTNVRRNRLSPKNLDMIIFLNTFCR